MHKIFREYLPLLLFAMALSLLIFSLLPEAFSKYKLEERFKIFNNGSSLVFHDLDNDGVSECIDLSFRQAGTSCRVSHLDKNGETKDWIDELGIQKNSVD